MKRKFETLGPTLALLFAIGIVLVPVAIRAEACAPARIACPDGKSPVLFPAGSGNCVEGGYRCASTSWAWDRLTWTPGVFHNKPGPLLRQSDPRAITHTLVSRDGRGRSVEFGFNDAGGGYLWSAKLTGFAGLPSRFEVGVPGYGKGMLGAIRDQFHSNAYNPEQAGRNDHLGAPVRVLSEPNAIVIPQFKAPLFADGSGGKTDRAHFDFKAMESEFDFSSVTRDAAPRFGVPAITHEEYWAFARKPAAITEFTQGRLSRYSKAAGSPVLREQQRILDISPDPAIDALPEPTDMSFVVQTIRGIRPSTRFKHVHYRQGGRWVTLDLTKVDRLPMTCSVLRDDLNRFSLATGDKTARVPTSDCVLDAPFMVFSDSPSTDQGVGMALHVPQHHPANARQVKIIDASTGALRRSEDRRFGSVMVISKPVGPSSLSPEGYWFVAARNYLSGLLSPVSAEHFYGRDSIEILTNRSDMLFGTPTEIWEALQGKATKPVEPAGDRQEGRAAVNPGAPASLPAPRRPTTARAAPQSACPATPQGDGYDIIVVAGQSNAVGVGMGKARQRPELERYRDRIFQLVGPRPSSPAALSIVPATEPLRHWGQGGARGKGSGRSGFAIPFALEYAGTLPPGRKVLLIPAAKGATSILQWDGKVDELAPSCRGQEQKCETRADSTELYDDLRFRLRYALSLDPGNRLGAVLWHQGEADIMAMPNLRHPYRLSSIPVGKYMTDYPAEYRRRLASIRDGLREEFGCFPFLMGRVVETWSPPGPRGASAKDQIMSQLDEVAASDRGCARSAIVPSSGIPTNAEAGDQRPGGAFHFSAEGQQMLGGRYWTAFRAMNSCPGAKIGGP